jgi:choline dehydrogenase-like flavoprotein
LGPLENINDIERIPTKLPANGTELMTIHLTSSCAMSKDTRMGVTDPWGAVHGEKNLHVVDAGILPTAPGVNPQGPLLALVRRNMCRRLAQRKHYA